MATTPESPGGGEVAPLIRRYTAAVTWNNLADRNKVRTQALLAALIYCYYLDRSHMEAKYFLIVGINLVAYFKL